MVLAAEEIRVVVCRGNRSHESVSVVVVAQISLLILSLGVRVSHFQIAIPLHGLLCRVLKIVGALRIKLVHV